MVEFDSLKINRVGVYQLRFSTAEFQYAADGSRTEVRSYMKR